MWKKLFILCGAVFLVIGILVSVGGFRKSKSRRALEAYIAELRAQGELLDWEELGSPWSSATNAAIDSFLAAVNRRTRDDHFEYMQFVGPGTAQVGWTAARPPTSQPSTDLSTWEQFITDMNEAADALAQIRAFLEDPPPHSPLFGPNRLDAKPRISYVATREAAQWLGADSLAALHEGDKSRAHADLHALAQLTRLRQHDNFLVGAMVSIAVAGFGLSATWEGLQEPSWNEEELMRLQSDWEAVDLITALEAGIVGERAFVLELFESPSKLLALVSSGTGGARGFAAWGNVALERAGTTYWRFHVEEDELLYLRTTQERLDLVRRLKTNAPAVEVEGLIRKLDGTMQSALIGALATYRHHGTLSSMPYYSRAVETVAKNETQRRLTVIAIALQRYYIKAGQYPQSLSRLQPEFLSETLLDPMSGQPFGYRTNADGPFTLYSGGEDGVDDGGYATRTNIGRSFELWSGRDAVWPRAVTNVPDTVR